MSSSAFIELGLIGYPLGHSLSPRLHNAALAAAGLAGAYRLYPIAPTPEGEQEMAALVERVRTGAIQGLNVTIPHKQQVRKFVDVFTPVADAVGAVNTIYRRQDGKLVGDNTDVPGFMRDIQYLAPDPSGVAVVFGAGGSARAVVYGLCSAGWVVHVLSRRPEQASQLVDEIVTGRGLSGEALAGRFELEDLRTMISGPCGLLVNTTPVGMYPKMQETPWPPGVEFPQHTAVYDLIYNPLETLFLHQARAAGLRGLNGAGMLVNQAALAFQHWTGCQPPFEVMQQAFPRQLPLNQ